MNIKDAWRVLWHGLPEPQIKEIVKTETVVRDVNVVRHALGSINLKDIKDMRDWTESDRKNHLAEIGVITAKRAFKLEIDALKEAQVYYMAAEVSANPKLAEFSGGTLNGIELVRERFEQLAGEHYQKTKPKEVYDPYGTLPDTPVSAATMAEL